MPFDNRLVTVKMTGKNLDLLLQIGSSGAHGIMQVAGATYHFDPDKKGGTDLNGDGTIDTWETRRLCSAQVAGEPIDPERIYEVATSDFIFGGGDHMQPAFEGLAIATEGELLRDVMIQYLESQDECLGESAPLIDPANPRITVGPCPQ